MNEQMTAGAYTALGAMNIRAAMNTKTNLNIIGGYKVGEPFTVYEVFQEVDGVLWGRVSSGVGGGSARYVALRVNNHPKAKMALSESTVPVSRTEAWMLAIDAWARRHGYDGVKP